MSDVVTAAKATVVSAATGSGLAIWLGAVLPLYIQVVTAFTLTCTAAVFVHRFVVYMRKKKV
jgi:hypothetical protein